MDAQTTSGFTNTVDDSPEIENALKKSSSSSGEELFNDGKHRDGSVLTAIGHTITAVIGAGVLSLPHAVSMLGWVAGPICLLLFAWVTYFSSRLLSACGVVNGVRQTTYTDMVFGIFGRKGFVFLACVQQINLFMGALAYQITAAISFQTVARSMCDGSGTCFDSYWKWSLIYGAVQMLMIQLPSISHLWWASLIGAAMSFAYSTIVFGMSVAQGNTHGTVGGVDLSPSKKAFGVLNAIGNILFAYSFSLILIEIMDTIKVAPGKSPVRPMQRAVSTSLIIMTLFYLAVAISGYMAFGNAVPGNILTAFPGPAWLVDWANIMVIIHLIPAYQIYSQAFVNFVELRWNDWQRLPSQVKGWPFRIVLRCTYVAFVCFMGILLPFFGDVIGLVGAFGYWPATVFFPIECWIRIYKPRPRYKLFLRTVNVACFVIVLAAFVGSIELIVVDSQSYTIFSE